MRCRRVPLSAGAAGVLDEAQGIRENDLVFPSATGRRMSDNTLSKLLRDLGIDAVPHGFRSSFRDWCGESGQPRDLAEAALAHTIRNKAEAPSVRRALRAGQLLLAYCSTRQLTGRKLAPESRTAPAPRA